MQIEARKRKSGQARSSVHVAPNEVLKYEPVRTLDKLNLDQQ
jgi:hypothetical protein